MRKPTDKLDRQATTLYELESNYNVFGHYFTKEELVRLWQRILDSPFGKAYDDEVYDALKIYHNYDFNVHMKEEK